MELTLAEMLDEARNRIDVLPVDEAIKLVNDGELLLVDVREGEDSHLKHVTTRS